MTLHSNETVPSSAIVPGISEAAAQSLHDIRAVNEQLLLAGLREQTLADQLRHQLAFITAITSSLVEGVYVLDTVGRCTFVNPAAEQMLGWTSDQLRGQHSSAVFSFQAKQSTSLDAVPPSLVDVLRFGTVHRDQNAVFVQQGGGTFPTAYAAAPIIIDGQIVGAVITFRDMTEVRRLQRMREEYLALISHDLRAPLTAILGRAQILVRRLMRHGLAQEAASANIVVESSLRMNDMIEDLLERTATDATRDAQDRSEIDLVALVQQMIDQTIGPDAGAQITLHGITTLPIIVEAAQIERVVVNLLTNALKFSPGDRPIAVQVYQQATNAIMSVTDQGIGIAPADFPHLFEKHYRAQTVRQIAGNGLGLYSSRLIVEAHGGRLWAESTVGAGSTFTVALPLLS